MDDYVIDIYYLKTDVVGELMTWLRKTGEAKLLIVAEGMRLQSSKAAHEEIRSEARHESLAGVSSKLFVYHLVISVLACTWCWSDQ
ncbi:hypothetical protein F2Q69_00036775 [Brassica cretica]|uniref:Uncharacterized protein n=1 Tax=Brassica cretica TaxID=69181 RepID=A0A8S9SSS2_BRACR|nr:hypothetical protein F2Q69_00036775 [Brassica cretica]